VPISVTPNNSENFGQVSFTEWLNNFKICNRPIMSPEEVDSCFLC